MPEGTSTPMKDTGAAEELSSGISCWQKALSPVPSAALPSVIFGVLKAVQIIGTEPAEVLKLNRQKEPAKSYFTLATEIYRKYGLAGFNRGVANSLMKVAVARTPIAGAVLMGVNKVVKDNIDPETQKQYPRIGYIASAPFTAGLSVFWAAVFDSKRIKYATGGGTYRQQIKDDFAEEFKKSGKTAEAVVGVAKKSFHGARATFVENLFWPILLHGVLQVADRHYIKTYGRKPTITESMFLTIGAASGVSFILAPLSMVRNNIINNPAGTEKVIKTMRDIARVSGARSLWAGQFSTLTIGAASSAIYAASIGLCEKEMHRRSEAEKQQVR